MKSRNSITLVLSIIFLFCFIPHVWASDDSGSESTDSATDVQLDNSTMNKEGHNESSQSQGTVEADAQEKAEDKSIKGGSEPGDSEQESSSEEEAVTKEGSDVESEGDNSTESEEEKTSTNNEADTESSEEADAVEENESVNDTGDNESEEEETDEENANAEEDSEEAKENEIQLQSESVLKKGDKNEEVKVLKENLNKLGFNGIKVTDYFGDFTEQRVKDFQDYYNLDVDGIAGESTLNKIDEILNSPLQKGEYNKDVIPFKKKLNQLGYDGIAISDNFGSHTERRVKEFQSDQGLPVSGILEEVTRAKINALSDGGFSEGDSHPRIAELKRNLNRLGFDGLANANLYGSFTTKRVKEFQEYYGLNPTGNTDSETLEKVDEILSSPLQKGKHNKGVIPFKEKLNRLGYDGIAVSGNFGPYTEKQVKAFQKDYNLPESGIIESITKKKINEIFADIFSKGGKHESVKEMKRNLNRLGFGGLAIADSYGSFTAKRVKEFQVHYGLKATGNADLDTLKKIDSLLSSPMQKGKHNKKLISLKDKLNRMGYDGIAISNNFGSHTERRVKEFQKDHDLPASGIIESLTEEEINGVFADIFSKGGKHASVREMKRNLNRLGFDGLAIADTYGSFTAKRVKQFQEYYGIEVTGNADLKTLNEIDKILSSPLQKGKRHPDAKKLKRNLNRLGYDGLALTNNFGSFTEKRVKDFQRDYGLPISGIADKQTLEKIKKALKGIDRTKYNLTLEDAVNMQSKVDPQTDKSQAWVSKSYIENGKVTASVLNVRKGPGTPYNTVGTLKNGKEVKVLDEMNGWYSIEYDHSEQWVHANPNDIKYHLNPNNFIDDSEQKFQFLDLSRNSGASKTLLDNYLAGKGTLDGQGQAFINAGKLHGINDVYLISHATLETGNGTSKLASGVKVGKDKSGELVLVTKKNKSQLKNIKTVYNMFGVNAFDSCALECGAKKAYKEGWTTPAKAIEGGASFIGNSYIKKGQNTLYQMRWNPGAMENGNPSHQYATDIGWATKQVDTMYNLYQSMKIKDLYLDIPEYK